MCCEQARRVLRWMMWRQQRTCSALDRMTVREVKLVQYRTPHRA
jgi:hypothetical protein